jgi:clan AA aspartic protease (TIGR02281 family)
VQLESQDNAYFVSASINGSAPIRFALDTGSAITLITHNIALALERSGQLSMDDFVGSHSFTMANGTTDNQMVYRVKSLTIGGVTVHDVLISVGNDQAEPLLGLTVLQKFRSWSIDTESKTLTLNQLRNA